MGMLFVTRDGLIGREEPAAPDLHSEDGIDIRRHEEVP